MQFNLYTIGHSTHSSEQFIELLAMHSVNAVADVRSHPYSRYTPQFNREPLQETLRRVHIHYVFLGEELGARSQDSQHYLEGKVQYAALASTPQFRAALKRIESGLGTYRIALLCAEKDPIVCHRAILVCRHLRLPGIHIGHIREDGMLEAHSEMEKRLLRVCKLPEFDMFTDKTQMLERAYDLQGDRIAYRMEPNKDNLESDVEELSFI